MLIVETLSDPPTCPQTCRGGGKWLPRHPGSRVRSGRAFFHCVRNTAGLGTVPVGTRGQPQHRATNLREGTSPGTGTESAGRVSDLHEKRVSCHLATSTKFSKPAAGYVPGGRVLFVRVKSHVRGANPQPVCRLRKHPWADALTHYCWHLASRHRRSRPPRLGSSSR